MGILQKCNEKALTIGKRIKLMWISGADNFWAAVNNARIRFLNVVFIMSCTLIVTHWIHTPQAKLDWSGYIQSSFPKMLVSCVGGFIIFWFIFVLAIGFKWERITNITNITSPNKDRLDLPSALSLLTIFLLMSQFA